MQQWFLINTACVVILVVLLLVSVFKGLKLVKVLKELYFYRVFTLEMVSVTQIPTGISISYLLKRFFPAYGIVNYSDTQLEQPRWLQFAMQLFILILILVLIVAGVFFVEDEDNFIYIIGPVLIVEIFLTIFIIWIINEFYLLGFTNSFSADSVRIYQGNNTTQQKEIDQYQEEYNHLNDKFAMEQKTARDFNKSSEKLDRGNERLQFEIFLLVLIILIFFSLIWSVMVFLTLSESVLQQITIYWCIVLVIDIPLRFIIVLILSYCRCAPKFRLKRPINANVAAQDLSYFNQSPPKLADPLLPENLGLLRVPDHSFASDNQATPVVYSRVDQDDDIEFQEMTDRPGSSTTYITGRNRARGEEHKAIYDYQSTGGELSSIDEDGEYNVQYRRHGNRLRGPSVRGSSLFLNQNETFEDGRSSLMDKTMLRNQDNILWRSNGKRNNRQGDDLVQTNRQGDDLVQTNRQGDDLIEINQQGNDLIQTTRQKKNQPNSNRQDGDLIRTNRRNQQNDRQHIDGQGNSSDEIQNELLHLQDNNQKRRDKQKQKREGQTAEDSDLVQDKGQDNNLRQNEITPIRTNSQAQSGIGLDRIKIGRSSMIRRNKSADNFSNNDSPTNNDQNLLQNFPSNRQAWLDDDQGNGDQNKSQQGSLLDNSNSLQDHTLTISQLNDDINEQEFFLESPSYNPQNALFDYQKAQDFLTDEESENLLNNAHDEITPPSDFCQEQDIEESSIEFQEAGKFFTEYENNLSFNLDDQIRHETSFKTDQDDDLDLADYNRNKDFNNVERKDRKNNDFQEDQGQLNGELEENNGRVNGQNEEFKKNNKRKRHPTQKKDQKTRQGIMRRKAPRKKHGQEDSSASIQDYDNYVRSKSNQRRQMAKKRFNKQTSSFSVQPKRLTLQASNKNRLRINQNRRRRRHTPGSSNSSRSEGIQTPKRNQNRPKKMIAGLEEISSASESDISVIEPTNPFSIKRPHKKISSFNTFKPRWARSKLGSKLDAKQEQHSIMAQRRLQKWKGGKSTVKMLRKPQRNSRLPRLPKQKITRDPEERLTIPINKKLPMHRPIIEDQEPQIPSNSPQILRFNKIPNSRSQLFFEKSPDKSDLPQTPNSFRPRSSSQQDRQDTMRELLDIAQNTPNNKKDLDKLASMLKRRSKAKKRTKKQMNDQWLYSYDHPYKELLWLNLKKNKKSVLKPNMDQSKRNLSRVGASFVSRNRSEDSMQVVRIDN